MTGRRSEKTIASIKHQPAFVCSQTAATKAGLLDVSFFRQPLQNRVPRVRALLPLPLENPRNPSNRKGFGDFPFCQKTQNAAKYAEKLQQKWYKSCTCVGKSWGIQPSEKWLQTQQYQRFTVFSLFARRGNPWGKSTENLKEAGMDSNIYHIPTGN